MCFDATALAPAAAGDDLGDGSTPVRLLGGAERLRAPAEALSDTEITEQRALERATG
ncbi:MAG TPA: hypothetical protein VNN80_09535 [Polyangiaceae bacterium]|nr:hypothetical protein [Polyangiaceae bacterium]